MEHGQGVKDTLLEYNDIMKENDELYRLAAKWFGLPDAAFWILYALREQGSLTQSALCGMLYMPKQTVNSSLKQLEADGYLKLREMTDRRSKEVCLTKEGERLAARTVDKVFLAECGALSGLTGGERETLIALFRKFTGLFKEQMKEMRK